MKVGDFAHGGIYAGDHDGNHIICLLKEYESPVLLDWHQAVEYCEALGMLLPADKELNLLYELSKLAPGQFRTGRQSWYWTSTECSSTGAWDVTFRTGVQGRVTKTCKLFTRPIIRIKIES